MIITQPPDAKIPEHLFSYVTLPDNPNPSISQDDPFSTSDHSYPPGQRQRFTPSIAESDLPPAYGDQLPPPQNLPPIRKRNRRRRRLRIAISSVLFIYIACTTTLLVLFWTGHLQRERSYVGAMKGNPFQAVILPPGTRPPGAPVSDGYAETCNSWTGPQQTSSRRGVTSENSDYLQYTLAPDTNVTDLLKLFVHAQQGAASSGTFTINSEDSIGYPVVDVTMKYRSSAACSVTSVCLMRTYDSVGLGIYTSNTSAPEHPSFDISLHLPSKVFVNELDTILDFFTQNIGNAKETFKTQLGLLQLQGIFAPMYVNGIDVTAQNIVAETSFSTIWGAFTTSESLTLKTSQAAINVNVSLVRLTDDAEPVNLTLTTENAIVQSAVTVLTSVNTTCSDPSKPDFQISASSMNAPVSVLVTHDDASSAARIDLSATTSYAPVIVSLDPMFEGVFSLSSNGVGVDLEDEEVDDPTWSGFERQITVDQQGQYQMQGLVEWGTNWDYTGPPRLGNATLATQHAKAVLYLKKSCTGNSCPDLNLVTSW